MLDQKQVDPTGKRTIGVLTKPDLINPGGEAEVLEVLSNNRKPLKLGYVMVKVGDVTASSLASGCYGRHPSVGFISWLSGGVERVVVAPVAETIKGGRCGNSAGFVQCRRGSRFSGSSRGFSQHPVCSKAPSDMIAWSTGLFVVECFRSACFVSVCFF